MVQSLYQRCRAEILKKAINALELDKESRKILRCFVTHKEPLSMELLLIFTSSEAESINECISYLLSNELIEMTQRGIKLSDSKNFRPTRKGINVLENELRYHRDHKFNEFRAWVTLLIAVIALILSIVK